MSARVGFFDESLGVRSSTRLILVILTILEAFVIGAIVFVGIWGVVKDKAIAQILIAALTLANAPLIGGLWIALREKRKGDETMPAAGGAA